MSDIEEVEKFFNDGVEHTNRKEYDKAIECFVFDL